MDCRYNSFPGYAFEIGGKHHPTGTRRAFLFIQREGEQWRPLCQPSRASPRTPFKFRRTLMNSDTIAGNWKQLKGKVKEKWGKLTDDDLTTIEGKKDQLVGKLQERYGYVKEKAQKEADEFYRDCNC
jgi:uncharacterized protein YjbJ (UPF0337 family)